MELGEGVVLGEGRFFFIVIVVGGWEGMFWFGNGGAVLGEEGVHGGAGVGVLARGEVHGVFEDFVDEGFVDGVGFGGEAVEEGVVAEAVDDAGGASGEACNFGDGVRGEACVVGVCAGNREAVVDVGGDFFEGERFEMVGEGDALAELFEVGLGDFFAELGLADEDDLEELFGGGFEIGEHAEFFEDFVGEVLGFINDDDDEAVLGKLVDEELVDAEEHGGLVGGVGDGDGEFVANEADELDGVEVGVADEGDLGVVFEVAQEEVGDEGFAGADFAGEQDEAAALFDGIDQIGEGFIVARGFVKELGIGGVAEGELFEVVVREVHAGEYGRAGEWDLLGKMTR